MTVVLADAVMCGSLVKATPAPRGHQDVTKTVALCFHEVVSAQLRLQSATGWPQRQVYTRWCRLVVAGAAHALEFAKSGASGSDTSPLTLTN
jgi:hypothetical protein